MSGPDPWVHAHSRHLARLTPWPADRWTQALNAVAGRDNRDRWIDWLHHQPAVSPYLFEAAVRDADAYHPDFPAALEQQAATYRRLNGLPPDAPLTIDLPGFVADRIAEIAAAEAAAFLADQPAG